MIKNADSTDTPTLVTQDEGEAPFTPGALTRSVALVCATALVLVGGAATAAGAAGPPPPDHPVDHPDPEAYRALAIEVAKNTARIAQMGPQIDAATARITVLQGQIATTQSARTESAATSAR